MTTTIPFSRVDGDDYTDDKNAEVPSLLGVDYELSLYDLTTLFFQNYRYHNDDFLMDFDTIRNVNPQTKKMAYQPISLSRFQALRRIEAIMLGSRPYFGGKGIAKHIPNTSMGYMDMIASYLKLPYQSVFTDSDLARVHVDKKLYDIETLSDRELEDLRVVAANNPNISSNQEVSDDVSDAFSKLLRMSKSMSKSIDFIPNRIVQDGLIAFLHSKDDWQPRPVFAVDLITEPQVHWDPANWSCFFVINKLPAAEAVRYIKKPGNFWNPDALRWALECAYQNNNLLYAHNLPYNPYNLSSPDPNEQICGENFMVRSYYVEKSSRRTNIGAYYGNMLVVEAYYVNESGKVNKVIFYPTSAFFNTPDAVKNFRTLFNSKKLSESELKKLSDEEQQELVDLSFADVLFERKNIADSMEQAITIIPFDRAEPTLERQRSYCMELFSPVETVMKVDSSVINLAILSGVPFYKNRQQGNDSQDLLDLEIDTDGNMVDLGDRDFIEAPFVADLQSMLGVRSMLLQHIAAKAFLGGLDGNELMASGRGADLANLRLVRDGRVHKHAVEEFSKGLTELYRKIFRHILDMFNSETDFILKKDPLVQKIFFDTLIKLQQHPETLFEFEKEDVIPDTYLPYWLNIEAIRSGGSAFGAAELVLYTEIKNVFGDGLDQRSLQALNRMGIKSLLGSSDALDILGDPREAAILDTDQVHEAQIETAAIMGSVDQGVLSYETINVRPDKDDHVIHLQQVHNPKASQLLEAVKAGETTTEALADATEDDLETRTMVILKLSALATHIQEHASQLERFGRKREDINRLKEETNIILQSIEGLFNNLQITMRALQAKRDERIAQLQNLAPENMAQQEKNQLDLAKLQKERVESGQKLELANRIAADKQQQHIDKEVSKARDREAKTAQEQRQERLKITEIQSKTAVEFQKIQSQERMKAMEVKKEEKKEKKESSTSKK